MSAYLQSLKTVFGFTHVFIPLWQKYVGFVAVHPKTCATAILVLALLAIR
jgi:hypothetical protein